MPDFVERHVLLVRSIDLLEVPLGKCSRCHFVFRALTWLGHSAFRTEAGAAKILIDPFLSDNPSWDKGWSGYLAGKNSTQGGDR
jgi:hypothetical protein